MRGLITAILTVIVSAPLGARDFAIQAPDEVHTRQSVEVHWTAPVADGQLLEIRPEAEDARRVTYSYVRNNPERIEAPEQPGNYLLTLIHEGAVQAARPLRVVMATATIDGPASAGAGETIEVRWSGPANRSDLISWALRDGEFLRRSSYGYVGDAQQGARTLRAPAQAGEYDLIYRSGSTILARYPVTVGSVSASVSAPPSVHAGSRFTVAFEGPNNAGDRLTFSERGGEPRSGIGSYVYVGNTTDQSAVLRVDETPGEYDVVYVSNDEVIGRAPIDIIAASVDIEGPGQIPAGLRFGVTWRGEANAGDMILIEEGDQARHDYRHDYRYIDPAEASVELAAPDASGDYSLVFRTRGGQILDREPLSVTRLPEPPGQLMVTQRRASLDSDDAVGVILDASGSMLQRLGGERRIEIARATLIDLVNDTVPEGTGFALRVFGHREADSCRTDLEIPLGPLDPARVSTTIAGIDAMNLARTPIAASIARASADLAGVEGQRILVILTDGEETCEGDPASAIAALRELGWDIRVNIVGFAIDNDELEQTFESWAAAGGGHYSSASDADSLSQAMTQAVATPFRIIDEQGAEVATGVTGDEAVSLPPGHYRIVSAGQTLNATVGSEERTTVTLDP